MRKITNQPVFGPVCLGIRFARKETYMVLSGIVNYRKSSRWREKSKHITARPDFTPRVETMILHSNKTPTYDLAESEWGETLRLAHNYTKKPSNKKIDQSLYGIDPEAWFGIRAAISISTPLKPSGRANPKLRNGASWPSRIQELWNAKRTNTSRCRYMGLRGHPINWYQIDFH